MPSSSCAVRISIALHPFLPILGREKVMDCHGDEVVGGSPSSSWSTTRKKWSWSSRSPCPRSVFGRDFGLGFAVGFPWVSTQPKRWGRAPLSSHATCNLDPLGEEPAKKGAGSSQSTGQHIRDPLHTSTRELCPPKKVSGDFRG